LSPGRVCVTARLTSNGFAVASLSNDLGYNSAIFAVESCFMNSGIAGKSLTRLALGPGSERVSIAGDTSEIPDGVLYACTLTVAGATANGSYPIDNIPMAFDASSASLPVSGIDGLVNVTACAADCNGSGQVSINEVSRASGLFLGDPLCNASNPLQSCPSADMLTSDGTVGINEVSRAKCLFLSGTCSTACSN